MVGGEVHIYHFAKQFGISCDTPIVDNDRVQVFEAKVLGSIVEPSRTGVPGGGGWQSVFLPNQSEDGVPVGQMTDGPAKEAFLPRGAAIRALEVC